VGRGSLRVATIAGIAIEIHFTFLLIVLWGAWQGWSQQNNLSGLLYGCLAILLLFLFVLLHELAHALQAKRLNLKVRRITLLPIGGLAILETPPSDPWQELLVALSGPLLNGIVALIFAGIILIEQPLSTANWFAYLTISNQITPHNLLHYLFWSNVVLFLFNMLPAFPMDGGRIVRSALSIITNYELGTRLASWLGRLLALALFFVSLFGVPTQNLPANPLLSVIAAIVFLGAHQEEIQVRRRRALLHLSAGDICKMPDYSLNPYDILNPQTARKLLTRHSSLPVIQDERIVGFVDADAVLRKKQEPQRVTIAHIMNTEFPHIQHTDTLWVVYQTMLDSGFDTLPVFHMSEFLGVINADMLQRSWRHKPNKNSARIL